MTPAVLGSPLSVLSAVDRGRVETAPFPHIVIDNALPKALYDSLSDSFPSMSDLAIPKAGPNERWSVGARAVGASDKVTAIWRAFIAYHASAAFFDEVLALFGDHIAHDYPDRFPNAASLQALRPGIRKVDTFDRSDVLLDAQICGNTPAEVAGSVRTMHVDNGRKLFAGLFYMRLADDDAQGGDLALGRLKPPYRKAEQVAGAFDGKYLDDGKIETARMVPYAANRLVLFINSLSAIHGVTVRQPTTHPRRFVNLLGEIDPPLYSAEYGEAPRYLTRFR